MKVAYIVVVVNLICLVTATVESAKSNEKELKTLPQSRVGKFMNDIDTNIHNMHKKYAAALKANAELKNTTVDKIDCDLRYPNATKPLSLLRDELSSALKQAQLLVPAIGRRIEDGDVIDDKSNIEVRAKVDRLTDNIPSVILFHDYRQSYVDPLTKCYRDAVEEFLQAYDNSLSCLRAVLRALSAVFYHNQLSRNASGVK